MKTGLQGVRIVLVRHGQPDIALRPRATYRGFTDYIDAYEAAGLDTQSLPPPELVSLGRELSALFSSDRPRSRQSAHALASDVAVVADALFAEAPLAAPRLPLVRLRVPTWAVVARLLWHFGHNPGIENYRTARQRAIRAADILIVTARETGTVALVAHGYFNLMIGRELRKRGFAQHGRHRARYWNAVIYEWDRDT